MTGQERGDALSDAVLTGYIDGELPADERARIEDALRHDPWARDRLAVLQHGGEMISGALEGVLETAPRDWLERMAATAASRSRRPQAAPRRHPISHAVLALAACLLLALGGALGFLAGQASPTRLPPSERWLQAVAEQVSLYGPESLAAMGPAPQDTTAGLARLGAALSIGLPAGAVSLPGLILQRTDLLQIGGRMVGQLLYDGGALGPVALCITADTKEIERGQTLRRLAGMNLVYWDAGRHGFLLVGAAPPDKLQALAQVMMQRFPG